jgi:S-adenosylmethionine:tRNA ribosyltransferase-isomerase
MHLDDFSFHLPESSIAQEPAPVRTASRLMVVARAGDAPTIHATFDRLPEFLRAGDVLVVNRTRVVAARLSARRDDGLDVEVFFVRALGPGRFAAWVRPLRRLREGDELDAGAGVRLRYSGRGDGREAMFDVVDPPVADVFDVLDRAGHVPLPPYVHRPDRATDRERYQTVFARERGSVAAPTAGLHFDDALLSTLALSGVDVRSLLLHVGPGTFQPLENDRVDANRLHAESFSIDAQTLAAVAAARRSGRRVVAVGTTVMRALETAAARGWLDAPADHDGETDLFIAPGYGFRAVDALITNFHLPRSSLLILVCAFMGRERALAHYADAVERGYRFFSYGDAMLIS